MGPLYFCQSQPICTLATLYEPPKSATTLPLMDRPYALRTVHAYHNYRGIIVRL